MFDQEGFCPAESARGAGIALGRWPARVAARVTHPSGGAVITPVIRLATQDDLPAMMPLVTAAIEELQKGFLDEDQIRSSHAIMGVDTQLIDDGTYFVVEIGGALAGCGGWSRRATLYGGSHSAGRDAALLDPSVDPARVRAMYTHPDHVRRGVGRLILARCEAAAAAEGFTVLELMATLSGRPLYEAAGFEAVEEVEDAAGGAAVPLVRMRKAVVGPAGSAGTTDGLA
jgi:GNAT superfamily N-acetyltransferase